MRFSNIFVAGLSGLAVQSQIVAAVPNAQPDSKIAAIETRSVPDTIPQAEHAHLQKRASFTETLSYIGAAYGGCMVLKQGGGFVWSLLDEDQRETYHNACLPAWKLWMDIINAIRKQLGRHPMTVEEVEYYTRRYVRNTVEVTQQTASTIAQAAA